MGCVGLICGSRFLFGDDLVWVVTRVGGLEGLDKGL
jgi:hypothetical protein